MLYSLVSLYACKSYGCTFHPGVPHKRAKGQLRRLISLTSFQLKGNGWYATDYKDKKEKKKKKTDKGEEKADKKSEKATTA